jgi:hypothetical protein
MVHLVSVWHDFRILVQDLRNAVFVMQFYGRACVYVCISCDVTCAEKNLAAFLFNLELLFDSI